MRFGFACALVLAGCTSDNPLFIGDPDAGGGGGDGGQHDATVCPPVCYGDLPAYDLPAPVDLSGKPPVDLSQPPPADLAGISCASACNRCFNGVCCGQMCCASGEWCDNGKCRCGTQPACPAGQICASAGVGMFGQCGSTCCGGIGGPPCPL